MIPFDGWGHMEVDLLCADARIAVELDGGQHPASVCLQCLSPFSSG